MLPIDLVLVRHGQSEGNAAKRLSEKGDDSAFTEAFRERHSASFRLTDKGRAQARMAGRWIREHLGQFDRFMVSDYLRAMETAGLLDVEHARWYTDFYLTERDWGELELRPDGEREERFGEALKRREIEPFFWKPPNGESFAELCLRVDRVLTTLHRECSDKRVLIVCHGEVMRAFQVRIERLSQMRFQELAFSHEPENVIFNCQLIHYSRRENGEGKLHKHADWVRLVRPTEKPTWVSDWREIKRPAHSNADLLDIVSRTPPMIH